MSDGQSTNGTDRYRIGEAREELRQLDSESAAVVVLDDAWSRPGRQGAFGVDYPTHDLQVSYEILEVSWDVLAPGGWLICDADDWLAPRLESHIREKFGDVTAYGDYQGGGYRRRGTVTYVDVSGEPDQSTPGQYLSNGGYPVVFAHKGPTDRRSTACARQLARHPRRTEDGYPYGRGSVKPVEPYRRWIEGLTDPGETVVEPCAGTGPASIAAASLGRESIAIDIEEEARGAYRRRKSAYHQSEQTTLVTDGGDWNDYGLRTGTDHSTEGLDDE
jgi:hypothetical protein